MKNPHMNPLEGRSGNSLQLLRSLNHNELKQYIAYYQWRQANETFPAKTKNVYLSKAYFEYRTTQFIYDAQKCLAIIHTTELANAETTNQ